MRKTIDIKHPQSVKHPVWGKLLGDAIRKADGALFDTRPLGITQENAKIIVARAMGSHDRGERMDHVLVIGETMGRFWRFLGERRSVVSVPTHVDIPQSTLPDPSRIAGLEVMGGHVGYKFLGSSVVAFDEYEEGIWTASIWPVSGDGKSEALALAEQFRSQGSCAWAYSQDSDEPYDAKFGPRRPSAA